jgi:hypothetical protein
VGHPGGRPGPQDVRLHGLGPAPSTFFTISPWEVDWASCGGLGLLTLPPAVATYTASTQVEATHTAHPGAASVQDLGSPGVCSRPKGPGALLDCIGSLGFGLGGGLRAWGGRLGLEVVGLVMITAPGGEPG